MTREICRSSRDGGEASVRPAHNRAARRGLLPALTAQVRIGSLLALGLICAGCAGGRNQLPGCDFRRSGLVARMADHTLVRLRRSSCYGWCPEYAVEVDISGGVHYVGGSNVMTHGPATWEMSAETLQSLRRAVLLAWRTEMPHAECACGCVTDVPCVELTTWEKEAPWTVYYDQGCEGLPPAIQALELEVDRAVAINRWMDCGSAQGLLRREARLQLVGRHSGGIP